MALRVEMTGMPEMVALFNGFGGGASALVALSAAFRAIDESAYAAADLTGVGHLFTISAIGASMLVGWITLSGSMVAMMKLKGGFSLPGGRWVRFPTWGPPWLHMVKALLLLAALGLVTQIASHPEDMQLLYALVTVSLLLGILSEAYGQRVGVSVVVLFFLAGGALLWTVDEKEGIEAAKGGRCGAGL